MFDHVKSCSATLLVALGVAACSARAMGSQTPTPETNAPRQARELGAVQWQRRLEPALDEAKRASRPVLLLFQEVPG